MIITIILIPQQLIRTNSTPTTQEMIGIIKRKIVILKKKSSAMITSTVCRNSPNARLLAILSARVRTPKSNSPASTSVLISAWLVSALNQIVTQSPIIQTATNLKKRVISEEWESRISCRVTSISSILAFLIKSYDHTSRVFIPEDKSAQQNV